MSYGCCYPSVCGRPPLARQCRSVPEYHAAGTSLFMFSLQSNFTALANQKSPRDYFPISLIPFSYSYLVLPGAFGAFCQLCLFANAVYIIIPKPLELIGGRKNIHATGGVRGSQGCIPYWKVMPITFVIQSSIIFFLNL